MRVGLVLNRLQWGLAAVGMPEIHPLSTRLQSLHPAHGLWADQTFTSSRRASSVLAACSCFHAGPSEMEEAATGPHQMEDRSRCSPTPSVSQSVWGQGPESPLIRPIQDLLYKNKIIYTVYCSKRKVFKVSRIFPAASTLSLFGVLGFKTSGVDGIGPFSVSRTVTTCGV